MGDDGLYSQFRMIHDSISLPLVLYYFPEWTHNFVPPSVVSRLAEDHVIEGIKYTEYNFLNLLRFIEAVEGKIAVFTGSDAMAYSCLQAGGSGAVISVSNILPRRASSIYDLFREGKLEGAREAQESILPAIEAAGVGYFPAGLKEAMKVAGFPVGEVREPQTPLTEGERGAVRSLMNKAGLK